MDDRRNASGVDMVDAELQERRNGGRAKEDGSGRRESE